MERAKLIRETIRELYGDYSPMLYWANHYYMHFDYDSELDLLISEDGFSMEVDIPNESINYGSMNEFLHKFQNYVKEQYKLKYNIDLENEW
jgi:fructose-1,6-bisphosphatase